MRFMMKFLRDPFIQFLIAGIIIYTLFALTGTEDPAIRDHQINIDASTLEWIHGNFTKQFQRPPTHDEMDALVRTHIEHEVKYREALSVGLDERDSIVQRRLVQKFDFLFGDAAAQMAPDDVTLQRWYEEHRAAYEVPATISFAHYWFSPDSRKESAEDDARNAVAALQAGERAQGDPFPFDAEFAGVREGEVRRIFGERFAQAIFTAPIGVWIGPIESGLGFHAVHVASRTDAIVPPLADVRDAVLQDWRHAESEHILEQTVNELFDDYTVTIDDASLKSLSYMPESK